MPAPGFRPNTLAEDGCPVWIGELANDDPNHLVHVVRGLEPADALALLGADPQSITACELPARRPDQWTSLPRAAISPLDPLAVLLAGRTGDWTFIYDDLGLTLFFDQPGSPPPPPETAQVLSSNGEVAATGYYTINGHAGFTYAVNGEVLAQVDDGGWLTGEVLPRLADLADDRLAGVSAAFESAGTISTDSGELDNYASMRAICALAGLPRTMADLRQIPLLVAPLNQG
jgi:hypothetical protein